MRDKKLKFIQTYYPELFERLLNLYQTGGVGKGYKDGLYERVNKLRSQYNLSSSYMKPMREKLKKVIVQNEQLSFFDE